MTFRSDRKAANAEPKVPNHREKEDIENAVAQVYVVSAQGGEAFAVGRRSSKRTNTGRSGATSVPRIRARRHGLWHRSSLSQRHTRWPTQVDWRDPSRLRSLPKGKPYHSKAITNQSTGPLG